MFISTAASAMAFTVLPDLPQAETPPESASIATASGISTSLSSDCTPHPEHIRHMLFGTSATVQTTIRLLHHLGYAEPNDWSRPISTGRANEVMVILTKRVGLG